MRYRKPIDRPGLTLIQRLLRYYKFNLQEMADRCGCSKATMGRIARGEELPRVDVAIVMARAFRVKVDEIWKVPQPAQKGCPESGPETAEAAETQQIQG